MFDDIAVTSSSTFCLIISNTREKFFAKKLDLVNGNSKPLSVSCLSNWKNKKVLSSGKNQVDTANAIAKFFQQKN